MTEFSNRLRPRDEADLAELVRTATGPLEPIGGGTKRMMGAPVEATPLDLAAFNGIIAYEPAELTMSVGAATPLGVVERELEARQQMFAFEPMDPRVLLGSPGEPTVGGTVAAALAGPRRVKAGGARDHLLGLKAVNGRGEAFKAGGRVVKNVTGYDVPKLFAGSWGTLGVMSELTLKVLPAPETERTLILDADDASGAISLLARALGSSHEVTGAAVVDGRAAIRLEGFGPSVAWRVGALLRELGSPDAATLEPAASRSFWRDVRDVRSLAEAPIVWRVSTVPSLAAAFVARVALSAQLRVLYDWGGGLVWLGLDAAYEDLVRGALAEGHAMLFKAPAEIRARVPVFQPAPSGLADLERRVKASFDPDNRLNPGRMGR
ncbi:MAG: 2-hydroxy-acid oxidase [Rhodospirillales bacterium]|nr:2-hydroxy-acid oxidase [Rhodospirillales bacterium]